MNEIVGIYEILQKMPEHNKYGQSLYKVKCIYCGIEKISTMGHIKFPRMCKHTKVDGSYIDFSNPAKQIAPKNLRLYKTLVNMKTRCYNHNNKAYRWYGAKGVYIYDEWLKDREAFFDWAWNSGYSPELTIDRIDCDGPYTPDNCRWIPMKENSRYKSTTHTITVNDLTMSGQGWNSYLGVRIINTYVRKYGVDETAKFIEWLIQHPEIKTERRKDLSYYSLYKQDIIEA